MSLASLGPLPFNFWGQFPRLGEMLHDGCDE
jgi:hypothetical protein